jgi:membrane protein YqaA with SNARE-associated domain
MYSEEIWFFIDWKLIFKFSGYAGVGSILGVCCEWYIRKYAGEKIQEQIKFANFSYQHLFLPFDYKPLNVTWL